MARNVEIKARVDDLDALRARILALGLATGVAEHIDQDDSFFACAHGRLKLREFAGGHGELIAYDRPDSTGPKTSDYRLAPVADAGALRDALTRALGCIGRVRKQRTLLLAGRTRIHLDRVDGLGDHLELEVVLRDGESPADGEAQARELLRQLGIGDEQLIAGAYLDLLSRRSSTPLND